MINPDDIDKGSLVRYDPDLPGIDKLFDKVFDIDFDDLTIEQGHPQ